MSKTKASDYVYGPDDRPVTLGSLLDSGLARVVKVEGFVGSSRGKPRTAYFADMVDDSGGWEISKMLYESRTPSGTRVALIEEINER